MNKSINLPLRRDVPLAGQCSHGKAWDEFCRDCRIVSLRESLQWMEQQVKRDRAELEHLVGPCGCNETWPQTRQGVVNHHPECQKRTTLDPYANAPLAGPGSRLHDDLNRCECPAPGTSNSSWSPFCPVHAHKPETR